MNFHIFLMMYNAVLLFMQHHAVCQHDAPYHVRLANLQRRAGTILIAFFQIGLWVSDLNVR